MNRPLNQPLRTPPHGATAPAETAQRRAVPPADLENISLRELGRLVANLRVGAVVSLLGMLGACGASLFWAGQKFQCNLAALAMERPFSMKLAAGSTPSEASFPALILTPAYSVAGDNGATNIVLTLRQRNAENLYDKVGEVVAQKAVVRSPVELFGRIELPIASADAQDGFDWGKHAHDNRFNERFVDKVTIHRFYDDGSILEYRVDQSGRAIAKTLKWIKA